MSKDNQMRTPRVDKVMVHIGVGESGDRLNNAEKILETITKQSGVRTKAKKTLQAFGIKKNEPIGCKVTLRGELAEHFLRTSLAINNNTLRETQFDDTGNFSFGLEEHTDFPGMKYDPNVGIFGMDVTVAMIRAGYRINRRKVMKHKLPNSQKLKKQDVIAYMRDSYGVEVVS